MTTTEQLARTIYKSAPAINRACTRQKNNALKQIRQALIEHTNEILQANRKDLEQAKSNGIQQPMLDRLMLTSARIADMAQGVQQLITLPDPVGQTVRGFSTPSGLRIQQVRVPFGIVGVIFESRPNVTVDAAALCLKAGNAVLLRGGKEAIQTNSKLVEIMQNALEQAGMSRDVIGLVQDTSRQSASEMMTLRGILDVLIPRGGAGLIQSVVRHSTVPVIETGTGNCHIYVDQSADLSMALEIVYNAKVSRPSVCNAAESLLVHQKVAQEFLPQLKKRFDAVPVILHGCDRTCRILDGIEHASEEDFATEYLDYQMSVKIVDSVEQAVQHINQYSTGHSECIVTETIDAAEFFFSAVDSAAVYLNASTRFTDGGEFGLGAEIGISTQKLHARGPMGLCEMTSLKYIIRGNGQIR